MNTLQARLAKLRASNQAIKAVTDRIDSSKVLGAAVLDELDVFMEEPPIQPLPTLVVQEVPEPVMEPVAEISVEEIAHVDDLAEPELEAVFVKDVAPQVAGVSPEILEMSPAAPEAPEQEPPNAEVLKVRREGGA
jgi:hypothetical protein